MNKKSQVKLGILLALFVLVLVVVISAISFNSSVQNEFYTNESTLTINLENYFSQPVTSYSLNIVGSAFGDVIENKLQLREINSSLNISLVVSDENITKEFYVYFNEEKILTTEENLTLINETVLKEPILNETNIPETNTTNQTIEIPENLTLPKDILEIISNVTNETIIINPINNSEINQTEINATQNNSIIITMQDKEISALSSDSTLYWVGNSSGLWSNSSWWSSNSGGSGGAGIPNATTTIVFDSANRNNSIIDSAFAGLIYSLNVSIGYNGTIESRLGWNKSLNVSGDVIISNGTLTHGDNSNAEVYRLNMLVGGNFTLEAGGSINATGLGYNSQTGPGSSSFLYRGASYGGWGASWAGAFANPPYGSITSPTNLGSGGSSTAGGGAVIINVTGTTWVNGSIISSVNLNGYQGSGGSIYLITGTITGNGNLSVKGGDTNDAGNGGGGRIAIILTNGTDFGNVNFIAYGGSTSSFQKGGAGTIYLKTANQTYGQLIIDNNNLVTISTTFISENVTDTIVGDVIIRNQGRLNISVFTPSQSTSLTIYGNLNKTSTGNFSTGPNSTIIFAGTTNSTIYSNETFYNLNITKLGGYVFFPAGGLTNITGSFNVLGNSTNNAFLRSSTTGTKWKIIAATNNINYANVNESNNTGSQIYAGYSTDGLANNGWTFYSGVSDWIPPTINFISPTPANNTYQGATSFIVNTTISEINGIKNITYTFNNTNYSLYDDSLLLLLNFDNVSSLGDNSTDFKDMSKYGKNGTMYGNTLVNVSDGKYGGGLHIDGTGDYANIPSPFNFDQSSTFTINVWAKLDNLSAGGVILSQYDYTGAVFNKFVWSASHGPNSVSFTVGKQTVAVTGIAAFVNTNRTGIYSFLSFRYNNRSMSLFVNGALINSTTFSTSNVPAADQPLTIGANRDYGVPTSYGNLTLDEVRVYNVSLSNAEIQNLYFSNLKKINSTNWELYVNQSKNSTTGLDNGTYTYTVSAYDTIGNVNTTETRTITIDTTNPNATILLPANNSFLGNETIILL